MKIILCWWQLTTHERQNTAWAYEGKHVRLVDADGWEFAERIASGVVVIVIAVMSGNIGPR